MVNLHYFPYLKGDHITISASNLSNQQTMENQGFIWQYINGYKRNLLLFYREHNVNATTFFVVPCFPTNLYVIRVAYFLHDVGMFL